MAFPLFKPEPFFNRTQELAALDRAWKQRGKGGQMTLLRGRRRLGKTYLLQRYFTAGVAGTEEPKPHCYYLAEQTSASSQRQMLAEQLLALFPTEGVSVAELAVSWNALLRFAGQEARKRTTDGERFGLILDEFPYLVEQTPGLPSVLQAWWDREGLHTPIYLILCGSQLGAMTALGAENAPLFGRFNAGIFLLEPLSYAEVAAFYVHAPFYGTVEKLLMYGILGGTPRYHALVDTSQPMDVEIPALLMQPLAVLENEVRFLLGSENLRDPSLYNAVLGAIASGATQSARIHDLSGVDKSNLPFYLKSLLELGWIRRKFPFGETSERRAVYRIADPFLMFWYRFVMPLASTLQFSDAARVYRERVAPFLADYMGLFVFEEICAQWLQKRGRTNLGLDIREMGSYWSRDGRIELDIMAELNDGTFLFGECKWSANSLVGLTDYSRLRAKIAMLPEAKWREGARCILFSVGGFAPEVVSLAANDAERLHLVSGSDLL